LQIRSSTISCEASLHDRRIGGLVDTVGTAQFDQAMLGIVNDEIGCSHLTAFSHIPGEEPRMLLAIDRDEPAIAGRIADRYLTDYWEIDPIHAILRAEPRVGNGAIVRMRCDEIDDPDYRRICYGNVRLVERVSFVNAWGKGLVRLNFYCRHRSGHFAEHHLSALTANARLLTHILLKHDQMRPSRIEETQIDRTRRRLTGLPAGLSPRETSVCAEIVQGRSSGAIALKMGISVNTVLTHRKRAYAKLNISSQNELTKMVMN
jgi:DNA-binding CsgD family transcriptional regulator